MASLPTAKHPEPRPVQPVLTSVPVAPINGGGRPLVRTFVPRQESDLIRSVAIAARPPAVHAELLIRRRAHVRRRRLTQHVGPRNDGGVPARTATTARPAPAVPSVGRAEVETAVPARPDVRAVSVVVRVVALASGPFAARPLLPGGVPPEARLNVAKGPALVVGAEPTKARLEVAAVPSKAVPVVLQVLLAAQLRPVVPATVPPLTPAPSASLANVKAASASPRRARVRENVRRSFHALARAGVRPRAALPPAVRVATATVAVQGTGRAERGAALFDPSRPANDARAAKAQNGALGAGVPAPNVPARAHPRVHDLVVNGEAGEEETSVLAAHAGPVDPTARRWLAADSRSPEAIGGGPFAPTFVRRGLELLAWLVGPH